MSSGGWNLRSTALLERQKARDEQRQQGFASTPGLVDFAAEGRKLLQAVNLRLDGAPESYANANAIYQAPGGGRVYVGNAVCAKSREQLAAIGCTRIVYCQDPGEGSMAFEHDPAFRYLAFPIGALKARAAAFRNPAQPTPAEARVHV